MQVGMWRLSAVRHKARPDRSNLEEFKFKRREQEKELRQARRNKQLVSKRHLQEDEEEEEEDGAMDTAGSLLSKEQVVELFRCIQHSGEERVNHLRALKKALRTQETQLIFIKLENSMQVLVGLLSGSNALWQLEAAHCLFQLSHSPNPAAGTACLPATPYLLTYLSGQSDRFTELCLYTLGNLCAECEAVREKLLAQGIVPALASCLQRHNLAVVEAAGFTLSQLLQAKDAAANIVPLVLASGLTLHLLAALMPVPEYGMGAAIECAWCLHYLVCSNVDDATLSAQGVVSKCSSLLITLGGAVATGNTEEGVELLVWPLLRSLGNLLSGCGSGGLQAQLRDSRLLPALCVLAQAFLKPRPALARESLWVLNNLTAGSGVFCSAVLFLNLVPALVQLLPFSQGINCMVLQVLGNIAHQGTEYCTRLNGAGLLPALSATLKMADPEVVTLSLEVLAMMLASSSEVAEDFTKLMGLPLLEAIQYNSQGEMRLRASYILDHYLTSHSQVKVDTPAL
ncbi:transmembrane and coiled-coil domain-containing protein 6 isoform X1 [Anguilla anguilla]|uniref:transmembrane and coiled-coil domain-containing protein 6 isoform X1 n=2 Tax=Anguilla anguilla TaxID=7936 RepID=UPI0015B12D92|nr:transmembrane and coiled-coil domain-containing protein 6 isoform X1 [Anguilla anguilla]XP_035266564.1 transmembrane and coiled-coil domain-containing protein 6 isoform X1 [Anguilla anguilla]